ncbi:MAG: hypothetical protein HUJ30_06100 [Gammaproteobacteria bacterium]|nr:hypothetical protein [Gammaproteobacteria bacterium]
MEISDKKILKIGLIACAGALLGVVADYFSGWSSSPNNMNTAISINIDSIKGLFIEKPRWEFVLGNYLGVLFIPFHMLGFLLVYLAIKPAGKKKSLIVLILAFYLVSIGSGFHGTFAFIGDTIQSGNEVLLAKMVSYWQNWGLVLIIGYLVLSIYLFFLIISGATLYDKAAAFLSPISLLIYSAVLISLLPEGLNGIKAFLAVTGLNLPLLIFYIITINTLLRETGRNNQLQTKHKQRV